jgi:hypothetical protein
MTATAPVRLTSKSTNWFRGLPQKLSEAAKEYKLPETPDWQPLDELSSQTVFDGIEVYGDSTVIEDGQLVAPATVYVHLVYDPNSKDPVQFDDSYPARVFYSVDKENRRVTVNRIDVDTSSFFE